MLKSNLASYPHQHQGLLPHHHQTASSSASWSSGNVTPSQQNVNSANLMGGYYSGTSYSNHGGGGVSNLSSGTDPFSRVEVTQATQIPPSLQDPDPTVSPAHLASQQRQEMLRQQQRFWGRLIPVSKNVRDTVDTLDLKDDEACTIGRKSSSRIHLADLTISSLHCTVGIETLAPPTSSESEHPLMPSSNGNDAGGTSHSTVENGNGVPNIPTTHPGSTPKESIAYYILDHGSSNGTFVNDQKLVPNKKFYIQHGDSICLVLPRKAIRAADAKQQQQQQHPRNHAPPPAPGSASSSSPPPVGFEFVFESIPTPTAKTVEMSAREPALPAKYALIEELGSGNFATVFRAVTRLTGEEVAIKVIERTRFLNMSEARWAAQVKEAETLRKLNHPNIVTFRDLIQSRTNLCVVMEVLKGGELYERLVNFGPYREDRARILTRRICEAVCYLHDSGIVHRDLKPENIILKTKHDDVDIKLVDFGVATEEMGGRKTFCGSMSYVAPEVLSRKNSVAGLGTYGKGVDMWSVGVIVHVVLTLRPPFDEDDGDADIHNGLKEVLKFAGEEWVGISDAAKSFVAGCLELNEPKRLTAKRALAHEWIRDISY